MHKEEDEQDNSNSITITINKERIRNALETHFAQNVRAEIVIWLVVCLA